MSSSQQPIQQPKIPSQSQPLHVIHDRLFEALVTVFVRWFAQIKNGGGKTTILKNMISSMVLGWHPIY